MKPITRYKIHQGFEHQLVEDEHGPYVLWKDASNIIAAIDRRHREVRDAIVEERDLLKTNLKGETMKDVLNFLRHDDLTIYTYIDSARCRQFKIDEQSGLFSGLGETIFAAAEEAMKNAKEKGL